MPTRLIALASLLLALSCPAFVSAQSPASSLDQSRPVVTDYSQSLLRDLPSADNPFSVLEVLQPTLITDRFTGGGLSLGQPARVGGFGPSWTQTLFQVDGVNITDPTGSGMPLLFPDLSFIGQMRVRTGTLTGTQPRLGLTVDITPVSGGDTWGGTIDAGTTRGGMAAAGPAVGAPALAAIDQWDRASLVAGGPFAGGRHRAVLGAAYGSAAQFDRRLAAAQSRLASALGGLTLQSGAQDQVRLLGWVQRRETPLEQRGVLRGGDAAQAFTAVHGQGVWERGGARPTLRAFAGMTRRSGSLDEGVSGTNGIMERLLDGPPQQFTALADQAVLAWSGGAAFMPRVQRGGVTHDLHAGIDASGGRASSERFYSGVIGELVGSVPARVWSLRPGAAASSTRSSLVLGATVADRVALGSRVTVDAGLRLESVTGSAAGAAQDISWQSLLPHASVEARLTERGRISAFGGYTRLADRLLLDYLAVGDPGAPTALVSRWNTQPNVLSLTALGPLVSRVGPGTGGDPAFSAIDSGLQRPVTNEFIVGIEAKPGDAWLFRFTGVARRQTNLLGLVNVGVPAATGYDTFTVADPAGNVLDPADDRILTVYDRRPASFGRDRYLLTNPVQEPLDFKGLEVTVGYTARRVTFIVGGTAGMATGTAPSRGFGALENDPGVLGEAFTDPNAGALARGRLFTDRAYTGKLATVFALPGAIRLGVIARYQDGQAFSRVQVFPALRQGADAVRAFPSGDSRFMFVGTLDARLQKRFGTGARSVTLYADGYNLTAMNESVEEWAAQRPDDRVTTAIQPPRSFHVGLRVGF